MASPNEFPDETIEAGLAELGDEQRAAVQAALANGFFDRPPEATAEEIATDLGISRSVFLYHLRKAEHVVIGAAASYSRDRDERD